MTRAQSVRCCTLSIVFCHPLREKRPYLQAPGLALLWHRLGATELFKRRQGLIRPRHCKCRREWGGSLKYAERRRIRDAAGLGHRERNHHELAIAAQLCRRPTMPIPCIPVLNRLKALRRLVA